MDLDVLGRRVEVRVRAVGLRERRDDRQFIVVLRRGPGRVVRRGLRRLGLEQHVRALVLDRLERSDRPTELHPVLRVLHRLVEHVLRPANHLVAEPDRRLIQGLGQRSPTGTGSSEQRGLHTVELELGLLTGLVHRGQGGAGQPGRVTVDSVEGDSILAGAARSASNHDDEVRDVTVEHKHLRAGQRCAVTRRRCLERDPRRIPLAARLGESQGGDGLAARDPWEQSRLLVFGAGVQDCVGRQHNRREVRRAQQRTTLLLEHDAELHPAEALAAVLLRDVQALQTQLVRHL